MSCDRLINGVVTSEADRVAQGKLQLSDNVFSWCVRNAVRAAQKNNPEIAVSWAVIAADIAQHFGSSRLASEELELIMRKALTPDKLFSAVESGPVNRKHLKWLHVFTLTWHSGGHTPFARRWIELDDSGDQHDIVLTAQRATDAVRTIAEAVTERGGSVIGLVPDSAAFVARAEQLRTISQQYDAVVLFTHPWDPVPTIAFSEPGGPPVFFLNHADHLFWHGGSVADLVLNIRPSGEALCENERGVNRTFRLPLPLPLPAPVPDAEVVGLRTRLGIAPDAVVFLTIGTAYKYHPIPGLNFMEAAARLLENVSGSHVVAVGPANADPEWTALHRDYPTRVHTVGVQTNLAPYHQMATVYLEGFPFGSLTAMLETVLAGVPPVLAPASIPLPYRSDDFSVEMLGDPPDVDAYVARATELAVNRMASRQLGSELADRVQHAHCEHGWRSQLMRLRQVVMRGLRHSVYPLPSTQLLDGHRALYNAQFMHRNLADNPFRSAYRQSLEYGLRGQIDWQMYRALRAARRSTVAAAQPELATVAAAVLSILPIALAKRIHNREG